MISYPCQLIAPRNILFSIIILLLFVFASPSQAENYNIVYIMADDIEQALDYKENIDPVLGDDISLKLKIVEKDGKFGVIYDGDDSSLSITKTLVEHSDLLDKAGFDQPYASKESDYFPLYNVSYGLGPHIAPLKKLYDKVYATLGKDVGRNLYIEKTAWGNYTLIYRSRACQQATYDIAKRHAKLLRPKKVKTSLTEENNNEVVFGESSLLNEEDTNVEAPKKDIALKDNNKISPLVEKKTVEDEPKIMMVESAVASSDIDVEKIYIAEHTNKGKVTNELASQNEVMSLQPSSHFEKSIESYIAQLRRTGKISKDEATGWMVFDLADGKSIVNINADRKFQAASMIKPFVALAFFHQVQSGKLTYGSEHKRHMTAMIQRSNNASTNWIMRQVGGPAMCEAILKKNYSGIFKGTEIKEYIPAGGRTYKNSAYPSDYVRFLRELWDKNLPYSQEMRRLMALPGRDRLYYGTPIPKGTLVYNKTGSTAHLCGDMGILVPKTKSGSRYPYVIVGVIERKSKPDNYGTWVATRSKVIREVSTLVYEKMKKEHKLL